MKKADQAVQLAMKRTDEAASKAMEQIKEENLIAKVKEKKEMLDKGQALAEKAKDTVITTQAFTEAKKLVGDHKGKAVDATGNGHDGIYRGGVGRHLPGVHSAKVKEDHDSRAAHFAGGRVEVTVPASESFTVQFWMWNGVINNNITVNNLVAEWLGR